ncbi:MAG: FAD-dependent monooxygenase [Pseudomonadota bacterium]
MIVIAGAGIAGLACALACADRGTPCHIVEPRKAQADEAGAGIQLGPNGVGVLQRLGLTAALEATAATPNAIRLMQGHTGQTLSVLPLGAVIAAKFGAPYLTLLRGDLHRLLRDAVEHAARHDPGLIKLERGVSVVGVGDRQEGVEVTLSDGQVIAGSVLIGADGLWSCVRGLIAYGDAANGPRRIAKTAARTVIPRDLWLSVSSTDASGAVDVHAWLDRSGHVVHYPVDQGRAVAVVVVRNGETTAGDYASEETREAVLSALTRFAPALQARLALAQRWRKWPLFDARPLPALTRGRIALIGDAAHPVLPFLAQGASMALEDAEALAQALAARPSDVPAALSRYDEQRLQRTAKLQRAAAQNGRLYHMAGLPAWARDRALRLVPARRLLARYDWLYGWPGPSESPTPGSTA